MSFSIIIIGPSGRMGKTIVTLAQEKKINVDAVLDRPSRFHTLSCYNTTVGSDPDELFSQYPHAVVIDFTNPELSILTAQSAQKNGNPIVIGTTGFTLEQFNILEEIAKTSLVLWSPNMSIGINVLLKVLPKMTQLLGNAYDLEIMEIHHNKKKDAPSGTALWIAETLSTAKGWQLEDVACYHREGAIGERKNNEIGVQTIRGGDVVGVHTIYFMGPGERIEITHQAHSRENFAQGSLHAAQWLLTQKPGKLYTMSDMLETVS